MGGNTLIRKISYVIFLAIIIGSGVLLGFSSYYAVDTYRAFGFSVEITDIRVLKNHTSGEYTRIEVDIILHNPSQTLPLEYLWSDTYLLLNGEELQNGWGPKYDYTLIPPGGVLETGWFHAVEGEDFPLLQAAETSDTWNWFLFLQPYVNAGFLGRNQVSRPLLYQNVTLVLI